MSNSDRGTLLGHIDEDKGLLALELSQVEALDQYLESQWGIRLPPSPDLWEQKLRETVPSAMLQRYHYLHDKQAGYLERGRPIPASVETRFYDVVSRQPLLGLVHSQKRTYILDSLALAEATARAMGGNLRILDVGCHVGYDSIWLSRELDAEVIGIDASQEAILAANEMASDESSVRFVGGSILDTSNLGEFDLLLAVDCYPQDDKHDVGFFRSLADRVGRDGVLLVAGRILDDHAALPTLIEHCGFGYGFIDIIGGWMGEGRGFEASLALALVKRGHRQLPSDFISIARRPWSQFAEYANEPQTQPHRKTMAYFRASVRDRNRH